MIRYRQNVGENAHTGQEKEEKLKLVQEMELLLSTIGGELPEYPQHTHKNSGTSSVTDRSLSTDEVTATGKWLAYNLQSH